MTEAIKNIWYTMRKDYIKRKYCLCTYIWLNTIKIELLFIDIYFILGFEQIHIVITFNISRYAIPYFCPFKRKAVFKVFSLR